MNYTQNTPDKKRIIEIKYYFEEYDTTDYYLPNMVKSPYCLFDEKMEMRIKCLYVDETDERYIEACNLVNCSGFMFKTPE